MLLSLAEGERHGYALKRDIARRTNGEVNLAAGALYGSISKMLVQGLIEESDERPDPHLDDERRRYWSRQSDVRSRRRKLPGCANWWTSPRPIRAPRSG
jgi:DNA-binding PadR family transcriptional regulator